MRTKVVVAIVAHGAIVPFRFGGILNVEFPTYDTHTHSRKSFLLLCGRVPVGPTY